jgi:hypothetical protein
MHVVIQIAGATGEDSRTDPSNSRGIFASIMADHGDRQALYDAYNVHMRSDSYADML